MTDAPKGTCEHSKKKNDKKHQLRVTTPLVLRSVLLFPDIAQISKTMNFNDQTSLIQTGMIPTDPIPSLRGVFD